MGYNFKGIYNLWEKNIKIFESSNKQKIADAIVYNTLENNILRKTIGNKSH